MSVILRHRSLPFIMVYTDPKKSWDNVSKKRLLEEIKEEEFDDFIEESSIPPLFHKLFNEIKEKQK